MFSEKMSNRDKYEQIRAKYTEIPVDVIGLAEELGIDVYEMDFTNSKMSGYISSEDGAPFICVNRKHPATRKLFTIAHEIGHFVLHEDILNEKTIVPTYYKSGNGINNKIMARMEAAVELPEYSAREVQANRFAAELLMPEEKFIEQANICDSLQELAAAFQVSVGAASIRACNLGIEIF